MEIRSRVVFGLFSPTCTITKPCGQGEVKLCYEKLAKKSEELSGIANIFQWGGEGCIKFCNFVAETLFK